MNISPMSKRAGRPSIGITEEDEENLERLMDAIPVLRSFKRARLLVYLVRVGMDSLAENPLRALGAEPTAEVTRANIEAAKARIRMDRSTPTPQELMDTPTLTEDKSGPLTDKLRELRAAAARKKNQQK